MTCELLLHTSTTAVATTQPNPKATGPSKQRCSDDQRQQHEEILIPPYGCRRHVMFSLRGTVTEDVCGIVDVSIVSTIPRLGSRGKGRRS
eukprot:scaffold14889_cov214-Alexandrium_tamarense.AAC.2